MTTRLAKGDTNMNLDPITGTAGAHPLGTGAGAAGGAATGAAIGSVVGGPVGFVVGGAIGAVAGGLAGHEAAEEVNPTVEDAYCLENFASRPYIAANRDYGFYQPAYRYGWEARGFHKGRTWNDVEGTLGTGWFAGRGTSTLEWDDAKLAAHDAWDRFDSIPD